MLNNVLEYKFGRILNFDSVKMSKYLLTILIVTAMLYTVHTTSCIKPKPSKPTCHRCVDAQRDPKTCCQTCKKGYMEDANKRCVRKQECPKDCVCRGFVPWTCTSCKDSLKTLSSNCKKCQEGYEYSHAKKKC